MKYQIIQIYKKFYVKREVHIPLFGIRMLFIRFNFFFRYAFDHSQDAEKFIGDFHTGRVRKEKTIKVINL